MSLKIVIPPAVEPISLTEAKKHLNLAVTDEDAAAFTAKDGEISRMISQSREYVEDLGLHALITQTVDYYIDSFPSGNFIRIDRPPLQSVESITYTDTDGNEAEFTDFEVRTHNFRIKKTYGVEWPEIYPESEIIIRFACGFGDTGADVPPKLLGAMYLLIAHYFENKSETIVSGGGYKVTSESIRCGVEALVRDWRLRVIRI